jgi:hypothetical protein
LYEARSKQSKCKMALLGHGRLLAHVKLYITVQLDAPHNNNRKPELNFTLRKEPQVADGFNLERNISLFSANT